MKFLVDTNVFIPMEPTVGDDMESLTREALSFQREVSGSDNQIYLHPASKIDIAQDKDPRRKTLRTLLTERYPFLRNPPPVSQSIKDMLWDPAPDSHDIIDFQLLAALQANAIDFLVTEDKKLRARAVHLGLGESVLSIQDALDIIRDLSDKPPAPPPAVRLVMPYIISLSDPILDSFREDYPGFNEWFAKCCREHRQTWIIDGKDGNVAGFCIVNPETKDRPDHLSERILKICSFKVSHTFNGFRYGELLLKAVLEHAFDNGFAWTYVTVFEKHDRLIELFRTFGFDILESRTPLGELIFKKLLTPVPMNLVTDPLSYHIRFGPRYFHPTVDWYTVPIQPRYSDILFPETRNQLGIFPGRHPFGNAIRKAYLCHSKIRAIRPGSALLFYRSHVKQGLITIGIVEDIIVSREPDVIARAVAKRTVYSIREIEAMCRRGSVLVILFRQARSMTKEIPTSDLLRGRVFSRPPQSIISVGKDGVTWVLRRIET